MNVLIPLTECDDDDPRSNLTFTFTQSAATMVMALTLHTKDLGFGSLLVHLISPAGTRSELKMFTEWSKLNQNLDKLELLSNEFLGEELAGDWIVSFPQRDTADRGVIVSGNLTCYYTLERPSRDLIDQQRGSDPFLPLNEGVIRFDESYVVMHSSHAFTAKIVWFDDSSALKKCFYNAYLQAKGQRVKLRTQMLDHNRTLFLGYVPSVFKNGTLMNLTVESLIDGCGFSTSVPIEYFHNMSEVAFPMSLRGRGGKIYPRVGNDTVQVPIEDWMDRNYEFQLDWDLDLAQLIDDGYACSVCISLLTIDTRQVIRRMFERNVGNYPSYSIVLNGEIPTNREYRLEISPSSAMSENFPPLYINIEIVSFEGRYNSYTHPFTPGLNIVILALLLLNFVFIGLRMWTSAKKQHLVDEALMPFKQAADTNM
jgi:hypothetical protein